MPGGGKGGGSTSSTVTVNNGPITVDSDSAIELKGIDKIGLTAKIEPLAIEQTIKVPEPIVTKSDSTAKSDINSKSDVTSDSRNALLVDLKPVVLDVCSTTSTKLPQGEIVQPYNLHFGITMFGMELFGFTLGGESRTVMKRLPKKPQVDWPAQQNAPASESAPASAPHTAARSGGLRIRIK